MPFAYNMRLYLRSLKSVCSALKFALLLVSALFALHVFYFTNEQFDRLSFPAAFVNPELQQHSIDVQRFIESNEFAVHLKQQLNRIHHLLCPLPLLKPTLFAHSFVTSNRSIKFSQYLQKPIDCDLSIDRQPESVQWLFDAIARNKSDHLISADFRTRHHLLSRLILLLNTFIPLLNPQFVAGRLQPKWSSDRPIIVIQVHNRADYLAQTIESLSAVKGIHRALLVFSHDVFSLTINQLVQNIRFCAAIQIYFPFSNQIYFNQFPGPSANDCPRNYPVER
jgi:hypothetical protein